MRKGESIFDILLAVAVFYPMGAALVSYMIGRFSKRARDYFADFVVISEFALVLYLALYYLVIGQYVSAVEPFTMILGVDYRSSEGILRYQIPGFAGMGLHFMLDGFRCVYVVVAALMWMMTTVFSKEYFRHYHNRNRYYLFLLLTLGATMGVFLSEDLFTTFIFFEMMSFTSYVWVAHDESKESLRAAETYLAVAVIGGMVTLTGLFLLYHELGTLRIEDLSAWSAIEAASGRQPDKTILYVAGALVSVGFAAKAGAFPLHIWLPKAHPVAPAPASALLSGILTKTGIFGLLIVSCQLFYGDADWGSIILLIGTITMFLGALLALFSVDLKRTLACSSVSQIGFILVGIGCMGLLGGNNVLSARGTLLHMVNHSLIKLVLFMAAGVVFMNVHRLNLNEIRGFGRKKPLLHFIFLMGALGIGGIPLWNGYVSKTLLHEGIVEYTELLREGIVTQSVFSAFGMECIEWIFLISGGITVAYMAKLYIAVFVEKNVNEDRQKEFDEKKNYMNWQSMAALLLSALLLPLMGFFPNAVMDRIADAGISIMNASRLSESINYFSMENLKGAGISIAIGIVLYLVVVRFLLMKKTKSGREYVNRWPKIMDLENSFYRPLISIVCILGRVFCRICDSLVDGIIVLLRKTLYKDKPLPFELAEGNLFTYYLGEFLNDCEEWLDRKFPRRRHKRKKEKRNYAHELAMRFWELAENKVVITRTLSFGFLLFCFGFVFMLLYLMLR